MKLDRCGSKQINSLIVETTLDWEDSMGKLYRWQSTRYQQFDFWPRKQDRTFL